MMIMKFLAMGAARWRACLALAASMVLLVNAVGATPVFGQILEPIVCETEPQQRYVLYVPTHYKPEQRWPVIFCFDASARGRMPVERLQAAAEKYGYIVAGSLNSRNGPWADNAAAAQAMIRDVTAHFSIDPQRIYTTGVSGGARVATAIALSGTAKGVIACAAGFPVLEKGIPRSVPFVFFGTTGEEDFNLAEMRRLDDELETRKAVHRLVVFDGGHQWAPADLMLEAVEWLELQAMRSGARPRDAAFIARQLRARTTGLPSAPILERWRALKSLVSDFDGLADLSNESAQLARLTESRELKAELKAERALLTDEDDWVRRLGEVALESLAHKKKVAEELRAKTETPTRTPERQMFRRVLASFFSMTRETVRGAFEAHEYGKAIGLLELAVALRPSESKHAFDLARAHAYDGNRAAAIAALEQAAAAGFSDSARVESDPAFAPLRSDPKFKEAARHILERSEIVELPAMKISAAMASIEVRPFYLPNAGGQVSGLSFLRVESVAPNSVGAVAGVEPGLEITAIDGVRIRGLLEQDLYAVLERRVKNEVLLTVRNNDRAAERQIHIPLRIKKTTPAD